MKLIDFGLCYFYSDNNDVIPGTHYYGSPSYSSLQVLNRLPHLAQQTDVFSLGVCLYRMFFGLFPFCNPEIDTITKLKHNLQNSPPRFPSNNPSNYEVGRVIYISLRKRINDVKTVLINQPVRKDKEKEN